MTDLPTESEPVTVVEGDALSVLRDLPDGCVDAVVTDPPWMDYETNRYDASAWHAPINRLAPADYCGELARVMAHGTATVLWCRWDVFEEHAAAMRGAGLTVRNCIVWAKPCHTAGDLDGNIGNKHEMAVFATKGRWVRHGSRDTNCWEEPHLFSKTKRHHPTEKPVGLIRRSCRLVCPPGGLILDPFAGSGTTGVAAVLEGRRAILIEKEPAYAAIARRRVEHALGRSGLFAGATE